MLQQAIIIFCFMPFFYTSAVWAQEVVDTVVHYRPVTIHSNKSEWLSIGHQKQNLDTAQLQRTQSKNLSDVLLQNSDIYIRSYGLGSLSTISIRGSASTQTAVLWNGINIQSPMNGVFDLSLIPTFFLEAIGIQKGAAGALTGSSAIGGNLLLNNNTHFESGWQVKTFSEVGSFNKFSQGMSFGYGNKKWYHATKLFANKANNDFKFRNTAQFGMPKQRQSNAEVLQYGLLHEQGFDFAKKNGLLEKNILLVKVWLQNNEREIPPSMTMLSNEALQEDQIIRVLSEWEMGRKKWNLHFKNAYFKELIRFEDARISLNVKNKAQTFLQEAEWTYKFQKRHALLLGINATTHLAASENFRNKNPHQQRLALFISYHYSSASGNWTNIFSLRQEKINSLFTPVTPSYQQTLFINSFLKWKSSISRTFRVPTLNDWFWVQGGNPDLKSEKGWAAESGVEMIFKRKKMQWQYAPTFFAHTLNQRIIWLPDDAGIWRPENLLRVNARGIEQVLKMQWQLRQFHFGLNAQYTFLKSTNSKNSPKKQEAGKQIIYTPKSNGLVKISVQYQNTWIAFTHQINGKVYYTADNSKSISASHVSYLNIAQTFHIKATSLQLFFKANNLFNQTYQVILWRAMPLRYYEFGIQFSFHQPLKNLKK